MSADTALKSACDDVRDAGDDDRIDGVAPTLVARPRSTEEVAEVMRAAAAGGLTVVPRGNGTKMSWGVPPSSVDVVVDVSGMDQVLDHQAGDLIVETQAGTKLADLQQHVAKQGQRLVLDETVEGASVGGTLATNASGPQRMLVGTSRDLLIGITMVRADGVIAKAGGRVVKNVAGYDIGKLLVGSFGTLGVITEALFRLHPVPEVQRWVTAAVEDPGGAHQLAQAVVHAQAVPAAVEVELTEGAGTVQVLVGGRPAGVDERVSIVRDLLGDDSTLSDEAPSGWSTYPWGRGESAIKLTFALSGLRDVLTVAEDVGARVRGSAGTGVVYAAIAEPEHVPEAVERLRAVCVRHQGACVVVDAPADVKQAVDVWGPVPAIDLMRRVKDQFDPDHRLAPGRFVGGI